MFEDKSDDMSIEELLEEEDTSEQLKLLLSRTQLTRVAQPRR